MATQVARVPTQGEHLATDLVVLPDMLVVVLGMVAPALVGDMEQQEQLVVTAVEQLGTTQEQEQELTDTGIWVLGDSTESGPQSMSCLHLAIQ